MNYVELAQDVVDLTAEVERPFPWVGAADDDGNRVVFSLTESYMEPEATGRRISMRRKNGVFV